MITFGKKKSISLRIICVLTVLGFLVTLALGGYLFYKNYISNILYISLSSISLLYIFIMIKFYINPIFAIDEKGVFYVKNLAPTKADKYFLSNIRDIKLRNRMGGLKTTLEFSYEDSDIVINLNHTHKNENKILFREIKQRIK